MYLSIFWKYKVHKEKYSPSKKFRQNVFRHKEEVCSVRVLTYAFNVDKTTKLI